jgi:hypothetical protein
VHIFLVEVGKVVEKKKKKKEKKKVGNKLYIRKKESYT